MRKEKLFKHLRLNDSAWYCSCNKWQTFGIPCSYFMVVCSRFNMSYEDFIEDYYKLTMYASCCSPHFSLYHMKIIGSHLLCPSYIPTHRHWENLIDRKVYNIIVRRIGGNQVLKYNVNFVVNEVTIETNVLCYRDRHRMIKKLFTWFLFMYTKWFNKRILYNPLCSIFCYTYFFYFLINILSVDYGFKPRTNCS